MKGDGKLLNQLRLDLHLHTWYSRDAIDPPSLVLKMAAAKGMYAIAITDHNTVRGQKRARECKSNVVVIPGIEVDAKEGHIIGLGISTEIKLGQTAAETVELIKDAGGFVVIPHPFDYIRRGVGTIAGKLGADAIEVLNSKTNTPFSNSLAKRLAKEIKSPITAGSDAHLAEDVGNAYVLIEEKGEPSVDTILSILASKKHDKVKVAGKMTSLRSRIRKIALQRMKRRDPY
jgi:predicted metal-dependent phosphoesterase TrpH